MIIKLVAYEPSVQPIVKMFIEEKATGVLWFSALFTSIFGPVDEEIFFRGFMYPAVKKKVGIIAAFLITSGIFALLHVHPTGFLPIMAIGALLVYAYESTGTLLAPILVHITHNLMMLILVFIVKQTGIY